MSFREENSHLGAKIDTYKQELGDGATLVNVPGAAHLLPLEQPDVTASHVIKFIRQLDQSR